MQKKFSGFFLCFALLTLASTASGVEYTLEFGSGSVRVARDGFGVPHVYAESIEDAFRAQGYVAMEDRFEQALKNRDAARGTRALTAGHMALDHDKLVHLRGYTDAELQAQVDGLRPDLRRYLDAYVEGINTYIKEHSPDTRPWSALDTAAMTVYLVSTFGDGGESELMLQRLLGGIKLVKGEAFAKQLLDDALPVDVPNAPTTDHTSERPAVSIVRMHAEYEPNRMVALLEREVRAKKFADADGVMTGWGSNAWVVGPKRSASGHAMLFGGPMMGFAVPQIALNMHLVAPGLNVYGMCFPGTPAIQIGHNQRVAWTTTSGGMNQTDYFVEELNPENKYQYRYNGEWKDMTAVETPVRVLQDDGAVKDEPLVQHRTVHGPVEEWDEKWNKAYARASTHRGQELSSFMSFADMDLAKNLEDFEQAVRGISSTHNFFAADVDGNIGYWLAGRFPIQHPDQDPRMPTPGTGEYDWQGVRVATDIVRSVNPPQGWFGNWNNKPSAKTPDWFPEMFWGIAITERLANDDSLTWEEFVGINRLNGEYDFLAHYFKPYLLEALESRELTDQQATAMALLRDWPNKKVDGEAAAAIFDAWFGACMVELFQPTLGPLVKPTMDMQTVRVFGPLMYRVLMPEKSGLTLSIDYLQGREGEDIAYAAFSNAIEQLREKHGDEPAAYPYAAGTIEFEGIGEVSARRVGTYCIAAELTNPIRAVDILPPGQSEKSTSPHHGDQLDLFREWKYKPVRQTD